MVGTIQMQAHTHRHEWSLHQERERENTPACIHCFPKLELPEVCRQTTRHPLLPSSVGLIVAALIQDVIRAPDGGRLQLGILASPLVIGERVSGAVIGSLYIDKSSSLLTSYRHHIDALS